VDQEEESDDQLMEEEATDTEGKDQQEEREGQAPPDFPPVPTLNDQRAHLPPADLAPQFNDPNSQVAPQPPVADPPAIPSGKRKREENDSHRHIRGVQQAQSVMADMMGHLESAMAFFNGHRLEDQHIGVGCPSSLYRQQKSATATGVILKSKTKQADIDAYNISAEELEGTLSLMMERLVKAFNSAYALTCAKDTLTSANDEAEGKAEKEREKARQKLEDESDRIHNQQWMAQQLAPYSARRRQ
jgi:hypothetical protein